MRTQLLHCCLYQLTESNLTLLMIGSTLQSFICIALPIYSVCQTLKKQVNFMPP